VNIILAGICAFFYIKKDRIEPKLTFTADDTIYTSGMDTNELIGSMSAVDNKDGDISDRIVIEKILENKEKNVAVVYYAVCDYDGNVAKASREFPADYNLVASTQLNDSQNDDETEGEETSEGENSEEATEEELKAQEEAKAAEEAKKAEEEAKAAEEAKKAEEEAKAAEEAKKAEEEAKAAEEAKKAEEAKSEEQKKKEEEAKKAEAEKAAAEAAKKSAGAPYIELNYNECKVGIGGGVPWADAIKTLRDDEDGYELLFRNLIASKFDNTKKGDYTVSLYTTDSKKNKSNTVTMIVHVQ